jgi:hypothetical protein
MEPINEITRGHVAGAPFQVGDSVVVIGVTADEPAPIVAEVTRRACDRGRVTALLYGDAFSGTRYPYDPGVHVAFDDGGAYTFRPEELA